MYTPDPSAELTSDDKLWALLCWLISPIFPIIVLLMEDKKNRPFLKYNAVHSLMFYVAVIVVLGTVTAGCLMILGAIAAIYFAIKAYQGEWVTVPVLTDFAKKQNWIS
jgi:uncharacterized membrane protein